MKFKNIIYIIILLFITLIGMWAIPSLVNKATYNSDQYPFAYYSTILKDIGLIDYKNKKFPMEDLKGNKYNTAQFDSLMPMLNYRQLMTDGKLPDSINGQKITPQLLRSKSVVYKYKPSDINTPVNGLYILLETMPKRVGLEIPNDVFRLKNNIEFIDAQTNTLEVEKSRLFQQALDKEGFQYPAQWLIGNPNPRKPYDEGYFVLDANNQLFHMKMVNNRPYIKNTKIGEKIEASYFSMLEVADKRFYGFLFSKQGELFIIENDGANYKTVKLDIDPIDMQKDEVILMGNMFDWTVSVVTPFAKKIYALDAETLKRIGEHTIDRTPGRWDAVSKWIFPVYLTLEKSETSYIQPYFHYIGIYGFAVNLIIAFLTVLFITGSPKRKIFNGIYIFLTGIAGLVALLILPNSKNK
ncbi:MAG TPA: DUF4857 domain-containing protein [Dysgonomonas sp.]|uniref:DUF4857 domain-containing protein n=1 Tax=unclassified Dysgonomonas TaxID=2630389 RepID=UPI0025C50697|nr:MULTISPECIES: DUF4857 domain-containing protein [unclassified Dysgonomonas]HML64582.1 DUF4857 domain-containing protein [Dysgonomonas sp.]